MPALGRKRQADFFEFKASLGLHNEFIKKARNATLNGLSGKMFGYEVPSRKSFSNYSIKLTGFFKMLSIHVKHVSLYDSKKG